MPTLTIASGLEAGRVVKVAGSLVIGRSATADLTLMDSGVSRRHARLVARSGEWFVEDLGSFNGTAVNRRRVQEATKLADGDLINIGDVVLLYSTLATGTASTGPIEPGPIERSRPEPAVSPQPAVSPEPAASPDAAEVVPTEPVSMHDGQPPAVVLSIPAPEPESGAVDGATWFRLLEGFSRISTLALDESALASFVVGELLSLLPQADRIVLLVDERGEFVPRAARTRSGVPPTSTTSRRLLRDVIGRRAAVLALDLQTDERFSSSESAASLGSRAIICAPILFQQEVYGVLQVDSATPGVRFDKTDLALVQSLASQIGMALGYARLHATLVAQQLVEHDLALAKKVQQHFLPDIALDLPGYSLAVEYRPALAVGGDVYDAIDLGNGRTAFAIGDVSGKGVSAALLAARLATDLRYQAAGQTAPSAILARANRALSGRDLEGMFVTAALAVLDAATGTVDLANAGHLMPLVRARDGAVTALGRAADGPLGLDMDGQFDERQYHLESGDVLVMFTDGVIEALDASSQVFGDERLFEAVRSSSGNAQSVRQSIVAAVQQFVGAAPQSDDLTILCVGRK